MYFRLCLKVAISMPSAVKRDLRHQPRVDGARQLFLPVPLATQSMSGRDFLPYVGD